MPNPAFGLFMTSLGPVTKLFFVCKEDYKYIEDNKAVAKELIQSKMTALGEFDGY